MNKIKITSWNIEGRLGEKSPIYRGSSENILDFIQILNSDIVILPEAHQFDSILDHTEVTSQLKQLGYEIYEVPYDDDLHLRNDTNIKQLSLCLLSKIKIKEFKTIRLGKLRNAFVAITDSKTPIRIIGIHLDDRNEETRINQMTDLITIINSSDMPTIMAGDFNTMHGSDLWPSKLLRLWPVRFLAKFIIPDLSVRATEMARGEAIKLLESQTKLIDADPKHQPTSTPKTRTHLNLPSIRLIQIDHIFISHKIKINKFAVMSDGGSDHRAITANIIF